MSHPGSAVSELNLLCRRVGSSSSDSSNSSNRAHLESFHLPSSPPPKNGKSLPVIQHTSSPPATENTAPASAILTRIRYFLENDYHLGAKQLVQTITSYEFRSFIRELQSPLVLPGEQVKHLRYDYDAETSRLTVKGMLTPVHEALGPTVAYMNRSIVSPTFLTVREVDHHVRMHGSMDCALPTRTRRSSSSDTPRKKQPSIKQPDAAFYYLDRSRGFPVKDAFPSIIFEVAFSQTYDSVVDAARQWIIRSEGQIKLAVVIKLTEGPIIPSDNADDSDASSDEEKYGSEFSCADAYNDFNLHCSPAVWVGPLDGFLELFRYDPVLKTVYQEGARINFFPTLPAVLPCIRATDFLRHLPATDARSYPIPLDYYADEIVMGVRALALKRKVIQNKLLKRKERGSEEDEYTDGSHMDDDQVVRDLEEVEDIEDGQGRRKKMKTGGQTE
ncbi:hypothetical protein Q9L58_009790 [Maublancomyces gigas]|uniref:Uncharacterized protein n=1 Tax=Discina gigas TaxID=1032678 RepID=A0ABR3G5X2_9PEZI